MVDKVFYKFKTHSITKTNNELVYAGAVVVTNRLGVKIKGYLRYKTVFCHKIALDVQLMIFFI